MTDGRYFTNLKIAVSLHNTWFKESNRHFGSEVVWQIGGCAFLNVSVLLIPHFIRICTELCFFRMISLQ